MKSNATLHSASYRYFSFICKYVFEKQPLIQPITRLPNPQVQSAILLKFNSVSCFIFQLQIMQNNLNADTFLHPNCEVFHRHKSI